MKHFAVLCGLIALFTFGARAQGVQGVFVPTSGEAYVGYSYMRFYALPGDTVNLNGFDASVAYYLHAKWFAPEGELTGVFGSQAGAGSTLVVVPCSRWKFTSGGRGSGPTVVCTPSIVGTGSGWKIVLCGSTGFGGGLGNSKYCRTSSGFGAGTCSCGRKARK